MKKLATIFFWVFMSSGICAQGYQPSEEQKVKAENLFRKFIYFVAEEKYDQAYELQTESMKKLITMKQWSEVEVNFRKRAGGKPQFGNIRATWYKDLPNAESPGIYVAFDYACRYENINICSGVVMLHSKDGDKFNVMRSDKKTVDKETEAKFKANEPVNK